MTANAIKRGISVGTIDLWSQKLTEGVSIRLILDRKMAKTKEARLLTKNFELRGSTSAIMRLTISDGLITLLCATDDVDLSISNPSDVYLKTNDPKFTRVMRLLFEHMWKNAKPVS